jgi:hypothetical protein
VKQRVGRVKRSSVCSFKQPMVTFEPAKKRDKGTTLASIRQQLAHLPREVSPR